MNPNNGNALWHAESDHDDGSNCSIDLFEHISGSSDSSDQPSPSMLDIDIEGVDGQDNNNRENFTIDLISPSS